MEIYERGREGDALTIIMPTPASPHPRSPGCLHIYHLHEPVRFYCVSESLTPHQLLIYGHFGYFCLRSYQPLIQTKVQVFLAVFFPHSQRCSGILQTYSTPHCWHRTPSQDFSSISPLYPSFSWSFSSLPPGGRVEFYAGLSLTRRKWHKGRNTLENFSGRFYVCGQHIDSHTFSFQCTLFIRAPNKVVGLHLRAIMS